MSGPRREIQETHGVSLATRGCHRHQEIQGNFPSPWGLRELHSGYLLHSHGSHGRFMDDFPSDRNLHLYNQMVRIPRIWLCRFLLFNGLVKSGFLRRTLPTATWIIWFLVFTCWTPPALRGYVLVYCNVSYIQYLCICSKQSTRTSNSQHWRHSALFLFLMRPDFSIPSHRIHTWLTRTYILSVSPWYSH